MILYSYNAITGKTTPPAQMQAIQGDTLSITLNLDFTGTGFEAFNKYINLVMADGSTDIVSLGAEAKVSFTLGSEHTKVIGGFNTTKFSPYCVLNGVIKNFPIGTIKIDPALANSIATASVQAFITEYIDGKTLTQDASINEAIETQNGVIAEAIEAQDTHLTNALNALDASLAIKSVNVTTLQAGSSATGSMTREVDGLTLTLGIPRGAKIISCAFVGNDMVFTLDDASTVTIVGGYTTLHGVKGDKGNQWRGAYVAGTAYVVDDVVSYNGSSYICILASTGNLPTNVTYWSLFATTGTAIAANVTNTPAGGISGVNVQLALNELDTEKADKLMATNLVTNGDFSDGTTGWDSSYSTSSVANNVLANTGNGTLNNCNVRASANLSPFPAVGKKYYLASKVRVTNSVASSINLYLYCSGANQLAKIQTLPVINTWYQLSGVVTIQSDVGTVAKPAMYHFYADSATANGKVMEVQYVFAIDLTAIFGAGLEPSKEQIDRLLSIYPNSWFNGTSEIANVKQLWNEKTDRILATNLVTNGDFSNGTTGWNAVSSTISALSNVLSVVGTGVSNYAMIHQTPSVPSSSGKKVYFKQQVRVTNANCKNIELNVDGSVAGTDQLFNIINPVQNTWYSNSFIATQPSNVSGDIRIKLAHSYADASTANGKVMEVQYVLALDLTQIFGAGKEPTAVQMDNLLANFPNSWFNGTVELASLLNILATKADKTQEAWITPTLLNGWVAYDASRTPGYMKDSLGFVHIKGAIKTGSLGTTAFNLPAGYRPLAPRGYALNSNNSTFGACYINSTGDLIIVVGNTALVYLDTICYKAEQ